MFDLSPASWCDTFVSARTRPTPANLEFIPRPVRLPSASQSDFQQFMRLAHQSNWLFDHQAVVSFLRNPRHVLLVTNLSQQIQFVNQGFTAMTGYERAEVMGRQPDFLQGPETSSEIRQEVGKRLRAQESFAGSLLNYRKNGDSYWCHLQITPLFTTDRQLTHYMAFEWEN